MRAITQLGRRGRTLLVLSIAALAASTAAWAYWSAPSSGSAAGRIDALAAPSITGATPGGGSVALSWSAVAAPAGGTVRYYVSRDGATAAGNCPSAAATGAQTSCTDEGVGVGLHTYTVTAVWRSWTAKSAGASAHVTSGAATHLVLSASTTTPSAGASDNLTITAEDAQGNTVASYAGAKSLTFSGAGAIGSHHPTVSDSAGVARELGAAESIDFNAGVATVTAGQNGAMTLYKAETASVKVSDGAIGNGGGTAISVAPASAAAFSVPTPSTQTAGGAFGVTLTALDAYGNVATSYGGKPSVSFGGPASSPSGKAPAYPSSVEFKSGEGKASIALYDAAESVTLTATQGSVTGTSAGFTVSAAAANSLTPASPGAQTAGKAFELALTAKDEYGNVATSYSGSKSVSFSGPSSSPGGKAPSYPSSVNFTAGEGKASTVTLYDAQTTTLTATQSPLKGTSPSFTVAAAPASSFNVPTPATQTAGGAFGVTLTAKDEFGNIATGYEGSKAIAFGGPGESPGGKAPSYPPSIEFKAGVGTGSIALYDAQTTTLTATQGAVTGTSGSFIVNSSSTTTFGVSVPSEIVAGKEFSTTLTAQDKYGNPTGGFTGKQAVTFGGPSNSPSNKAPVYETSLFFSSGKATARTTLYDAQTTALTAKSGEVVGTSESFAVATGAPVSFTAANPGPQTAGTAFAVTITGAKDAYGNSVSGSQPLGFSGPANAPDGAAPTYAPSATFAAGQTQATVTLVDAQTTSLKVTSGSASSTTTSFVVGAGGPKALSLAAATTTPIAGSPDNLTITAVDAFGNTAAGYSGNKSLTFSGPKAGTSPTVSNASGTPVAFGSPTTIAFASGVAKVTGSSNGVMKLYAAEAVQVVVAEGELKNGTGLAVTVEGAKLAALTLSNHNFGFSAKGKIEAGDSFAVQFGEPIAVNTMCSLWSGNTSNHSLTANNEVTVTLADGSGSSDDTLSVSASRCTFHLGTIDLGSNAYVSGGNATFSGNGSNSSTVEYDASTEMLEVELGGKGGSGTVKQVGSSAATLTPDANLTDEYGNAFAPFTTSTTTQF